MKVVKKLLDAGEISSDIISMTDEFIISMTPNEFTCHFEDTLILAVANLLAYSNY